MTISEQTDFTNLAAALVAENDEPDVPLEHLAELVDGQRVPEQRRPVGRVR